MSGLQMCPLTRRMLNPEHEPAIIVERHELDEKGRPILRREIVAHKPFMNGIVEPLKKASPTVSALFKKAFTTPESRKAGRFDTKKFIEEINEAGLTLVACQIFGTTSTYSRRNGPLIMLRLTGLDVAAILVAEVERKKSEAAQTRQPTIH